MDFCKRQSVRKGKQTWTTPQFCCHASLTVRPSIAAVLARNDTLGSAAFRHYFAEYNATQERRPVLHMTSWSCADQHWLSSPARTPRNSSLPCGYGSHALPLDQADCQNLQCSTDLTEGAREGRVSLLAVAPLATGWGMGMLACAQRSAACRNINTDE